MAACRSATLAWTTPFLVMRLLGRLYFQGYTIGEVTDPATGSLFPFLELGLMPISMEAVLL